jgi:hypothetical protein
MKGMCPSIESHLPLHGFSTEIKCCYRNMLVLTETFVSAKTSIERLIPVSDNTAMTK